MATEEVALSNDDEMISADFLLWKLRLLVSTIALSLFRPPHLPFSSPLSTYSRRTVSYRHLHQIIVQGCRQNEHYRDRRL